MLVAYADNASPSCAEHHAATYHFPDAYAGSNTAIRDTINNLIEKSPQNWHTTVRSAARPRRRCLRRCECTRLTSTFDIVSFAQVGLPFRRIEGTVVEWDEIRFDVRLMQRVPYEGVSRMTTSMKRKHRGASASTSSCTSLRRLQLSTPAHNLARSSLPQTASCAAASR